MLRVLESQAPPKQNATDTINTLSGRLASATLLEDRRAAILGLRSFAKEYPASVASGALRHLISALGKDVDDVDTAKVVLETLLMLFNPNENSPEASDDIALWLADEFSQRQDNITILLDFLDKPDFYSRLYSLQLLSAISSARPERTQECILSAPLGTGRLVSILDDPREAVRSAGLLLLNDITQASAELQKIVAFENAFERIFNLIQAEGSIDQGGIVVQDCLSLLANLLHLNTSNQSLFRETGFVPKLAELLGPRPKQKGPNGEDDEDYGPSPTKDRNLYGLLAVLRLFVVKGSFGTQANQVAFERHRLLQLVLDLVFDGTVTSPIRAEALLTCADMIRANAKLQERFAHIQVAPDSTPAVNGNAPNQTNGIEKVYIIEALLDLALTPSPTSMFDVRFASCECIHAYFYNHLPIRLHFLRRATEGHASGEDETSNILNILIDGPQSYESSDPYRMWFAAILMFHLLFENSEAKNLAMSIVEGDAESGEEAVTCIQAITGNLVASLQSGEDDRVCIGYLILLCGWLFEDADAVNDLLTEGSVVKSLVQATLRKDKGSDIVKGLSAFLLGILYEFSTKDSPISRRNLQPILLKDLGREQFLQKITQFREHPFLRDFEVLPQNLSSSKSGTLPNVFFDPIFVDFVKDNFSRVMRAIDRDPGIEVARQHEGIDRDLVDSLREQISSKDEALQYKEDALQKAQSDIVSLEHKLGQEQADRRRAQETNNAELGRIKSINDALHQSHESDMKGTAEMHRNELQAMREQHTKEIAERTSQIEQQQRQGSRQIEEIESSHKDEMARLQKKIADLENTSKHQAEAVESLKRTNDNVADTVRQRDNQISSLRDDKQILEESIELNTVNVRKLEERIERLEKQIQEHEVNLETSKERVVELEGEVKAKEEARQSAQSELDDLLIVLGDLEDKRTKDKKKLKELGAATSDGEDEEDEDDEDDDDQEDDGADDDDVD